MENILKQIKERLEKEKRKRVSWLGMEDAKCEGYEHAFEIVNQVAEEYSNDFCEWHKVKNGNAYQCNTHAEIHDSRVLDWCVCPYCGKEIKIAPYQPKGE